MESVGGVDRLVRLCRERHFREKDCYCPSNIVISEVSKCQN